MKVVSSLKPNHHNHVQICETLCSIVYVEIDVPKLKDEITIWFLNLSGGQKTKENRPIGWTRL